MKVIEIKVDPAMYVELQEGTKTFEFRKNDRDYQRGDLLMIREFDRSVGLYTNRITLVEALFILYAPDYGVPDGCCIISLSKKADFFDNYESAAASAQLKLDEAADFEDLIRSI